MNRGVGRCPALGIMLGASLQPGFISPICFHIAEHGDGTWERAACSQNAEGPKPNTPWSQALLHPVASHHQCTWGAGQDEGWVHGAPLSAGQDEAGMGAWCHSSFQASVLATKSK